MKDDEQNSYLLAASNCLQTINDRVGDGVMSTAFSSKPH